MGCGSLVADNTTSTEVHFFFGDGHSSSTEDGGRLSTLLNKIGLVVVEVERKRRSLVEERMEADAGNHAKFEVGGDGLTAMVRGTSSLSLEWWRSAPLGGVVRFEPGVGGRSRFSRFSSAANRAVGRHWRG